MVTRENGLIALNTTMDEQGHTKRKHTIFRKRLRKGFNEEKIDILRIIRTRMEIDQRGATPGKVRSILGEDGHPITRGALDSLLRRYEKWGLLESNPHKEIKPDGKPRRGPLTRLYRLTDLGRERLVKLEGNEARGVPLNLRRYKLPTDGRIGAE